MGWENISVMDLPAEAGTTERKFEPVPDGTYTLQVLGAQENKFRAGAINITTSITDEGPHRGRQVYVDLPNVDEQPWAAPVLKRMLESMGTVMAPYANPIDELNRIAQNGHSRFTAGVYTQTYTKGDGSEGKRTKINFRSISAAA